MAAAPVVVVKVVLIEVEEVLAVVAECAGEVVATETDAEVVDEVVKAAAVDEVVVERWWKQ